MNPLRKLPAPALVLSIALLGVSIGAIVIDRIGSCGACARQEGLWRIVAPIGAIGYALLTVCGLFGWTRLFAAMTAVAAAIHTALVAAMLVERQFCILCFGAAALALALLVVVLIRSTSRLRTITCIYVPGLLLASAPVAWAMTHDEARKAEREAFAQAMQIGRASDGEAILIQVFEQDHCGYCRDFREIYLPQLERDFRGRARVQFLPATATTWVLRTPTIVIAGGPVYEGLPESYAELRNAVERAISSGK